MVKVTIMVMIRVSFGGCSVMPYRFNDGTVKALDSTAGSTPVKCALWQLCASNRWVSVVRCSKVRD